MIVILFTETKHSWRRFGYSDVSGRIEYEVSLSGPGIFVPNTQGNLGLELKERVQV